MKSRCFQSREILSFIQQALEPNARSQMKSSRIENSKSFANSNMASPRTSKHRAQCPHLVSSLGALTINYLLYSIAMSQWISPVSAQCLDKTMTTFERIGGVTIKDAQLTILYQANMSQATIGHHHSHHHNQQANMTTTTLYQISTPITAECNNRCRRQKDCRAFLVDYSRHTCWSVNHPSGSGSGSMSSPSTGSNSLASGSGLSPSLGSSNSFHVLDRSPAPIHLEPTSERTAYFEKVCLNLPIVECERAWIFERVLSYHVQGHDDKIIEDVPSRLKCQEHCLNEQQFKCRSGEYDYLAMRCRLSRVDRHLKPQQFRPTSSNTDYFENQCVPIGQQCDAFDRFEDMDLGRAEIMRMANNSEQCQQMCTQVVKAFICRSFTWSPLTGRCYLNSANTFTVGGMDKLLQAPGLIYYQRNDCIDLKLECDTTSMTLNLRTNEPFRGRMYVRDGDPQVCAHTLGRSALSSSLSIPFQSPMGRCATRELPSRFSSVVVVQQHPLIQRRSDRYIKLVCDFQTANKTISSHYNVIANPWASTALINATSFAPKIGLRITDKFGHDVTGAKLGDELQLRIEAESDSPYDMMARSVLAKSGSSDAESIVLIDRDGCPADSRIFPPLRKLDKRTMIGRFDAFKFSSDAVVRFQVDVQFCLNSCPQTACHDPTQTLFNVNPNQLEGDHTSMQPSGSAGSTTTSSPLSNVAMGTGGAQENDEDTSAPLGYSRASTSTTYRPLANSNSDYLSSNSLMEPYPGSSQQMDNSLLSSRRSQPPANQPLGSADAQLASSSATGGGAASDQLFDPQAKEMARSSTGQQQPQHFTAPHHYHNQQKPARTSQQQIKPMYDTNSHNNALHPSAHSMDQSTDLSPAEMNAALNQQHDQNSHRSKRRRRSAEPMPTSPKHVPLQREIIIFERSSSDQSNGGAKGDESNPSNRPTSGIKNQDRMARGQTEARSAGDKPKRHQKAGKELQAGSEFNRYDLNRAEQLASGGDTTKLDIGDEAVSNQSDRSRALVCTTWISAALTMIAFCAIQLLTIGICVASWLRKNKLKQSVAQMTGNSLLTDEPLHHQQTNSQQHIKFLSQFFHQQPQHQSPNSAHRFF